MSAKCMLLFLIGAYFQIVIHTLEITPEQIDAWGTYLHIKYYDECKHLVSEETAVIIEDNVDVDNEETRRFNLCIWTHTGYVVNHTIDIDLMYVDAHKFIEVTPLQEMEGRILLNICKAEGEKHEDILEMFAAFFFCVTDGCQSDI